MTALHFFGMSICKVIYSLAQPHTHTAHTAKLGTQSISKSTFKSRRRRRSRSRPRPCDSCSPRPPGCQSIYLQLACCAPLSTTHFIREQHTHTHVRTLCCIAALVVVARLRLAMENLCDFSCFFLLLLSVLKWTQSDEQCFLISTKKLMATAAESGRFD